MNKKTYYFITINTSDDCDIDIEEVNKINGRVITLDNAEILEELERAKKELSNKFNNGFLRIDIVATAQKSKKEVLNYMATMISYYCIKSDFIYANQPMAKYIAFKKLVRAKNVIGWAVVDNGKKGCYCWHNANDLGLLAEDPDDMNQKIKVEKVIKTDRGLVYVLNDGCGDFADDDTGSLDYCINQILNCWKD